MIKSILDEIASESSTNKKTEILSKYKDNKLLERVLYLAKSKRVKFFIKQIPEYIPVGVGLYHLEDAITDLKKLSSREITGNEAIHFLQAILHGLTPDDAYVIERIIEKDLKFGMGTTLMNKVITGLIEKTPYMGAKAFSETLVHKLFATSERVISDIKADGRYANAIIQGNDTDLESRDGNPTYIGNAKIFNDLNKFEDCVLNGEFTVDGYDRYTANGIVASIVDIEGKREERTPEETAKKIAAFNKKHGDFDETKNKIRYIVWDVIDVEEYFAMKSDTPYNERKDRLVRLLETHKPEMISLIESKEVKNYKEAMEHFKEALLNEEEGTILKAYDGKWKNGKPNTQIKLKVEVNLDLTIVGFNYGTGKNANVISSIDVESSDGILKTSPAGINEAMMKEITENQDNLLGTIVEIKCSGLSKDRKGNHSVLHPVFKLLRDDKHEANSFQECVDIYNAKLGLS